MRTGGISTNIWSIEESVNELFTVVPAAYGSKKLMKGYKTSKEKKFIKILEQMIESQKATVKELDGHIKRLILAIRSAPRKHAIKPFYVYRGEQTYEAVYANTKTTPQKYLIERLNLKKGSTFESLAFNSFSLAPWIAARFSGILPCCIYRLKINPKIPHLIYDLDGDVKEYEVLLPPGKFKVIDIHRIQSPVSPEIQTKVYDIEYVGLIKA